MSKIVRFVQSPANWCGLALATGSLGLGAIGLAVWGAPALAAVGYAAGFGIGGVWMGFPRLSGNPWDELEFKDDGDARTSMLNALNSVRQLVDFNPDKRLTDNLQGRIRSLVDQLEDLLEQWERSKGHLSLEESFHARHIAISYLPDALKTYLSIPQRFATTKVLGNGKTAQTTFQDTLDELSAKVTQLTEDLADQDAQAFLNHSAFLQEKFRAPQLH